jgi:lipopolysaccharide transport system permease protein
MRNRMTLFRPFSALWKHRYLTRQLAIREVATRYKGTILGFAWPFLGPLVMLAVYTVVFGFILKVRWAAAGEHGMVTFVAKLYCGLLVFQLFQECLSQASTLIISVPNYVKKVIFPLDILPVVTLLAALFHGLVGAAMLWGLYAIVVGSVPWTVVWLPLVWLPLVLWALGLSWLASALGVFIRDMHHVVGLALQVLFFATPIFYPLEVVPPRIAVFLRLNPLAGIVTNSRLVLVQGQVPDWSTLLTGCAFGFAVLILGHAAFMRLRKAFSDVV